MTTPRTRHPVQAGALGLILLALLPPAGAARLAPGPAAGATDSRAGVAAAVPAPQAGLDLARAVIVRVDAARSTLVLDGQPVGWDSGQLRVYTASGEPTGPAALQRGQRIRYALEPFVAVGRPRRVVLIYLDSPERAP